MRKSTGTKKKKITSTPTRRRFVRDNLYLHLQKQIIIIIILLRHQKKKQITEV